MKTTQSQSFPSGTSLQTAIAQFSPFDPALGALMQTTITVEYEYTPAPPPLPPPVQPGIYFDTTTGVLTIRASTQNDTIVISPMMLDVLYAAVSFNVKDNAGVLVQFATQQIIMSTITRINYDGRICRNVNFINNTPVPCTVYGGTGTTTIQGGTGNDELYAGTGFANSIKGMAGDDLIVGGTGYNWLYGGAGNDTIIPGSGPNFITPD